MIVLVTGGRRYSDRHKVFSTLNDLSRQRRIIGLIHGCATGADALAKEWMTIRIKREYAECAERRRTTPQAKRRDDIQYHPVLWMVGCIAQWDDITTPPVALRTRADGSQYNAAAGAVRNSQMLKWHPNICVVFPGGSGTENMRGQAFASGIEIVDPINNPQSIKIAHPVQGGMG
ncbi:MAG: SLOG family protein [Armatimonadota bacterium]|nr:SLOG family protein [Armatimonadota bacterium]